MTSQRVLLGVAIAIGVSIPTGIDVLFCVQEVLDESGGWRIQDNGYRA